LQRGTGYYVFGYPAQLGGRVSPSGYVQANGLAGPRTAYATGRLHRFQGSGTWATCRKRSGTLPKPSFNTLRIDLSEMTWASSDEALSADATSVSYLFLLDKQPLS
jgi:hypothetical protein